MRKAAAALSEKKADSFPTVCFINSRSAQKSKKGCGADKSLQQFENALLKPALLANDTRDMLAALPSGMDYYLSVILQLLLLIVF